MALEYATNADGERPALGPDLAESIGKLFSKFAENVDRTAADMRDIVSLHDRGKAQAAHMRDTLNKATKIIIGVEKHDQDSITDAQDRFLWIKGRQKIDVRRIREEYLKRYPDIRDTIPLRLKMGVICPDDEATMGELDFAKDRHVFFTAVADDTTYHATSTPPPRTPSRLPLIPVNRQQTVPPMSMIETLGITKDPKQELDGNESLDGPIGNPTILPTAASATSAHGPIKLPDAPVGPIPSPPCAPIKSEQDYAPQQQQLPTLQDSFPVEAVSSADESANVMMVDNQAGEPFVKHEAYGDTENEPDSERSDHEGYDSKPSENPFLNSQEDDEDLRPHGTALHDLTNEMSPEKLEAGVKRGLAVLDQLQIPLQSAPDSVQAQKWLEQVETLRKQAVRSRTVVGVVGATGAGKSSVINALLEEERLVPTNCMRACSSVVTEMSYNDTKNPAIKYRAEIEFIDSESWRKELKLLFEELVDGSGAISSEAYNADSEAGVAYAKIKSVYHKMTRDQIAHSSVEGMMQAPSVQSVLGTTKKFATSNVQDFYRRLQRYVDSKEKNEKPELTKNGNPKRTKREMEFWPLIKVVKIYTRADALSTGAVIVDLPGVQDSNAARAAVAEGYMKQCTGLWIVAPITRAVDDRSARDLLGNSFKRQLKYDGTYSAVTFICSKTDDISRIEATDGLKLHGKMARLEAEVTKIDTQRKILVKDLTDMKNAKSDYQDAFEEAVDQLDVWEELSDKQGQGRTVYAPSTSGSKKRKRASATPEPCKKARNQVDSHDGEIIDVDADAATNESDGKSSNALSADLIEAKLEELKAIRREARKQKTELQGQIRDIEGQLSKLDNDKTELDAEMDAICIEGRNEYSREAIRRDFAAGIREIDSENAAEDDPDNFDPSEDLRDYDLVARSLPVFCVSSRAYQKLSGRLRKDNDVAGFRNPGQTEIPQLKLHCKELTTAGRQSSCRHFLNNLSQLLTSVGIWASDDGTGPKMTTEQRSAELRVLKRKLEELERALEKSVTSSVEAIITTIDDNIGGKLDPAIQAASMDAFSTAQKWGLKRPVGLYWSTYKAVCRRSGVYGSSAAGSQDFNGQLTEPIYKHLASGWERAFQRRLPNVLTLFTRSAGSLLHKFHVAVETLCKDKGHGIARIGVMKNQLKTYETLFGDLATSMIASINESQRDINREFTPVVAAAMESSYEYCAAEHGTGSFARMKNHMESHVSDNHISMFKNSCEQVQQSLKTMCAKAKQAMLDKACEVFTSMEKDYMFILGGVDVNQMAVMPRSEKTLRIQVNEVIFKSDKYFEEVKEGKGIDVMDENSTDSASVDAKTEWVDEQIGDGAKASSGSEQDDEGSEGGEEDFEGGDDEQNAEMVADDEGDDPSYVYTLGKEEGPWSGWCKRRPESIR